MPSRKLEEAIRSQCKIVKLNSMLSDVALEIPKIILDGGRKLLER